MVDTLIFELIPDCVYYLICQYCQMQIRHGTVIFYVEYGTHIEVCKIFFIRRILKNEFFHVYLQKFKN